MSKTQSEMSPAEIEEVIHLVNLENAALRTENSALTKELATLRPLADRLRAETNTMKTQIEGLRERLTRMEGKMTFADIGGGGEIPVDEFMGYPAGLFK